MKKTKKTAKRKWQWHLTETIDPKLSENEISDLINKKIAYLIIELENNPISYIINDNNNSNK